MDTRERNRYEMLIRVNGFGREHAADFPANSAGAVNFARVAEAIDNLREHAAAQISGAARSATTRKSAMRDAIRRKMKNISRTARALAIDNAGFGSFFKIPDGDNDADLIAAARRFAAEAAKSKTDFTDFGMNAGFIEDLMADIAHFENLLGEKAQATGDLVSATAAIDDQIERGMNAARRLDAIVRNVYDDDPATLAAWTSVRHVQKSRRSPAPDDVPVPNA